jgi:hypothetical protein
MGLTIHYSLALKSRSAAKARQVVEALRQRALTLPLKTVGEIIDVSGDAADFEKLPRSDPQRWLLCQANSYAIPKRVVAFSTYPGDGSEQANFGLCLYPGTIEVGGVRRRTGAKGWCWSSFCKTQYASNPECGGVENFLRCHLSVMALLDQAKALGVLAKVNDEGDYFEKRDVEALAKEVGEWNEMIAAGAEQFAQAISPAWIRPTGPVAPAVPTPQPEPVAVP